MGIIDFLCTGGLLFFILFLVILFSSGFYVVEQQTCAVIERFGKFVRIALPGLNIKIPFIEKIQGRVSLRILQLDVKVETKTFDDVFITLLTSVQYRVLSEKVFEAFYTLEDAETQIESFVFDVVRARVPHIKLDDVFAKKDEIANSVRDELKEVMNGFGYDIIKSLVTDIHPDPKVKSAMNEINEAQRLRIAATERGESEKILKVKAAEAEAESKILQGKGIAGQRKAIVDGLKESLFELQKKVPHTQAHEVMSLLLMAQYFDTLKEMSAHSNNNTIFLPHSPAALQELQNQIRTALINPFAVTHSIVPGEQDM